MCVRVQNCCAKSTVCIELLLYNGPGVTLGGDIILVSCMQVFFHTKRLLCFVLGKVYIDSEISNHRLKLIFIVYISVLYSIHEAPNSYTNVMYNISYLAQNR